MRRLLVGRRRAAIAGRAGARAGPDRDRDARTTGTRGVRRSARSASPPARASCVIPSRERVARAHRADCAICVKGTPYRLQYSETGDTPHTLSPAGRAFFINSGGPSPVTLPQPRCWPALDREPPLYYLSTTP